MSEALPLSRKIDAVSVTAGGTGRRITASEAERAALAEAYDLLGVDAFDAELTLSQWRSDGILVEGRVKARIRQSCVVSLAPVEQFIDQEFSLRLVPEGSRLAEGVQKPGHEIIVGVSEEDPPDIFTGKTIDLGAIVAEQFALGIDPYPRAPEAALPAEIDDMSGAVDKPDSPFAILATLKDRDGGKR